MWWVIPEGFIGQLVSGLASGPALHVYTVTQSPVKPRGAVAGPFNNRLTAQAKATALNQGSGQATPPNIAAAAAGVESPMQAIGDFFNRLSQPQTWVRVAEFLAGALLLAISVNAMTKSDVRRAATGTTKSIVKTAVKVAK